MRYLDQRKERRRLRRLARAWALIQTELEDPKRADLVLRASLFWPARYALAAGRPYIVLKRLARGRFVIGPPR